MLAENPIFQDRRVRACLVVLVIAVAALSAFRIYNDWSTPSTEFDWGNRGHSDFHYGTYLPTIAFRNGDSPYTMDVCDKYQMPRPVPAFSPALFVFHLPFSWLDLKTANIVFFLLNLTLLFGLGLLTVRMVDDKNRPGIVLSVILLILLSRPGHQTLYTGYFTTELAIGTLLALHFARSNPWLAAFGLLLTSFKPNFCVPLIILMSCRQDFRAVIYGVILCGIGALAGIGWLSIFSSPMEVLQGILQGQESHETNPTINPLNTWVRTDIIGMISKPLGTTPNLWIYLVTMIPMIAIPGMYLWKRGQEGYKFGASGATGLVIGLTMLVAFYHSIYDSLFLIAPWAAIAFYGPRVLSELSSRQRFVMVLLTAFPAVNYLSTLSGRKLLGLEESSAAWQWLTVSSGLGMVIALIFLLTCLYRYHASEANRPVIST